MLHVIGRLVALEPSQADLLGRVCSGPTISVDELPAADELALPAGRARRIREAGSPGQLSLFD